MRGWNIPPQRTGKSQISSKCSRPRVTFQCGDWAHHRVTSTDNREKKEGKVNLKCLFKPPFGGHVPHGTSCREVDIWEQEQAHELLGRSCSLLLHPGEPGSFASCSLVGPVSSMG